MAFSFSYVYTVIDKYSRPLRKIQKGTEKFTKVSRKAQKATKNFSNKIMGMQNTLTSAAGVIGGAAVVGKVLKFEESINKLNAVTLATGSQMEQMRDMAKMLGATTAFSASEAAQAMTFLAMASLDTQKVLEAIPGTLQLAAAGGLDLASAADIATNVLAQMKLEVSDLGRVNDVLAMIQARANTSVLEAAEAMKNVGTTAGGLGITLEQTTALIGTLANAGVKSGEAGTLLRNTMLRLVNPSEKAQKTFRKLGIDLRKFVTPEGKIKNFSDLIDLLGKRGATTAQIFTMFEERGGRAIQALAVRGKKEIDKLEKSLMKAGGTAEKMAKIQMQGLPGVMKAATSAFEAFAIAVFESGLTKFLINAIGGITKFIRWLSSANPMVLDLIAILGGVIVVGGPLLLFLGMASMAVSSLASVFVALGVTSTVALGPIGLIIIAIAALAVGTIWLWKNWDKVVSYLKKNPAFGIAIAPFLLIVAQIKLVIKSIKWLKENWDWLFDSIKATADDLIKYSPLGLLLKGISVAKGLVGGSKETGVAASGAKAMQGQLNGKIDVTAKGATVDSAELTSSIPGDLGFNMSFGEI